MLHAVEAICVSPQELDEKVARLAQLTGVMTAISAHAEGFLESLPFPAWVKDTHGRMIFVNQFYADHYKIDRKRYEGAGDQKVWGLETAVEFSRLDNMVNDTRHTQTGWETVADNHRVFVVKFPVYDGLEYIGPGGMVLYDEREAGVPRLTALHNPGTPGPS